MSSSMYPMAIAMTVLVFHLGCGETGTDSKVASSMLVQSIVDGTEEAGFPAVGALVAIYPDGHFDSSFCSATLIAPKWVLTAAHCIDGAQERARQRNVEMEASIVHFMPSPRAQSRDDGSVYPTLRVIKHPRYTELGAQHHYDIALIELANPVNEIEAYPLFDGSIEDWLGREIIYVGYGANVVGGREGGGVKRRGAFGLRSLSPTVYITSQPDGGVCFGDSGGPGLVNVEGQWKVIGVNSTTFGPQRCTGFSSQVRVDAFRGWLMTTMGREAQCDQNGNQCDCPEACNEDGVCDNGLCCQRGCAQLLNCVGACDEEPCHIQCMLNACPEDNYLLEELGGCIEELCPDRNTVCIENRCRRQIRGCNQGLDAVTGEKNCRYILECTQDCIMPFCQDGCFYEGTLASQSQYGRLLECASLNCATPNVERDMFDRCMTTHCRDDLLSCAPPDGCRLAGGDCPEGTSCALETWGATYCRPSQGLDFGVDCTLNSGDCGDGLVCLDIGSGPRCQKLCTTSAECRQATEKCERFTGEGVPFPVGVCLGGCSDDDGDGVCNEDDCQPSDSRIYPGATELCSDGGHDAQDEDCDGQVDEMCPVCRDDDGDGVCSDQDCDDTDPTQFSAMLGHCPIQMGEECDDINDETCSSDKSHDAGTATLDPGTNPEEVPELPVVRLAPTSEPSNGSGCSCSMHSERSPSIVWLCIVGLMYGFRRRRWRDTLGVPWNLIWVWVAFWGCVEPNTSAPPVANTVTTQASGGMDSGVDQDVALADSKVDAMVFHSDAVMPSTNGFDSEKLTDASMAQPDMDLNVDSGVVAERVPTIKAIQQGLWPIGEALTLRDVVVSSPVLDQGFFVSDTTSDAFSGVWVALSPEAQLNVDLKQGDSVQIHGLVAEALAETGAPTTESLTQILVTEGDGIERMGSGSLPSPILVTDAELVVPELAELYEGVLVRLNNLQITGREGESYIVFNGLTRVGSLFFSLDAKWNSVYTPFISITGILHFTDVGFVVMPRDEDDFNRSVGELDGCLPIGGYVLCTEPANFNQAIARCAQLGGRLVVLETPEQNEHLGSLVRQWYDKPFWIGLTDQHTEGVWVWLDGRELDFDSWSANEPNNAGGHENCVHSNWKDVGTWNDLPCGRLNAFVCEFRDGGPGCSQDAECGDTPRRCMDGGCVLE